MGELIWYFPNSIEELKEIVQEEGVVVHGGGTGLLRGDIRRYKGLVDLGKLGLSYIKNDGEFVEIGATSTYNDLVSFFKGKNTKSILYKSLLESATTPLRNRITIGGSVAYFPPWSDIAGPLLALSSEVYLTGSREGWFKLTDYVQSKELKKGTAILKIRYEKEKDSGNSHHFRAVRNRVDHPAFTITLLMEVSDNREIQAATFYVVGSKDRFKKLTVLESQVIGKRVDDIHVESLSLDNVEFYGKVQFSPEYQKTLFEVEVKRGIYKILEMVK